MPKNDKKKNDEPKEEKKTKGRTKCYALKKILLSGEKPNEFIKGEPLEVADKKFKQLEGADLVATKRPRLTEYECNQIEKKTGEKVKPTIKASTRHSLRA